MTADMARFKFGLPYELRKVRVHMRTFLDNGCEHAACNRTGAWRFTDNPAAVTCRMCVHALRRQGRL